jgi:hypothetical protein
MDREFAEFAIRSVRLIEAREPQVGSKPQNPARAETTDYARASRRAFGSQQRYRSRLVA